MFIEKQSTAINQSVPNTINFICEAINCSNQATEKINIDAGKLGIITFNLCSSCVKKFQLHKENVQVNPTSPNKTSSILYNNHSNNNTLQKQTIFKPEK
jgi:hypothetical protein